MPSNVMISVRTVQLNTSAQREIRLSERSAFRKDKQSAKAESSTEGTPSSTTNAVIIFLGISPVFPQFAVPRLFEVGNIPSAQSKE